MLIPLWAKAVEAHSEDPILMDCNAEKILREVGCDLNLYSARRQNPSQVGCCLRAKWIDDHALNFINNHPQCQVIQLGAGLDDRFRRIGMPDEVAHWYDLDLDEVAELRHTLIPEAERSEILAMNLFDIRWMVRLSHHKMPTLVIMEGIMPYLERGRVGQLFDDMARILGDVVVLFDSVPHIAVGRAKYHDSVQKYNKKVEYTFGLKEAKEVEDLSEQVDLVDMDFMSDLDKAYKFSWLLRMAYRIPWCYRNMNQLLLKIRIRPSEE